MRVYSGVCLTLVIHQSKVLLDGWSSHSWPPSQSTLLHLQCSSFGLVFNTSVFSAAVDWDRVVPSFLCRMQSDGKGQRWIGWFAYVLAAAAPDGFLMCHTHDADLVFRPTASSPRQISHSAETIKNTDKTETQIWTWQMISIFSWSCVHVVYLFLSLVSLFVRCFNIRVKSLTTWSVLKDLHSLDPFSENISSFHNVGSHCLQM